MKEPTWRTTGIVSVFLLLGSILFKLFYFLFVDSPPTLLGIELCRHDNKQKTHALHDLRPSKMSKENTEGRPTISTIV